METKMAPDPYAVCSLEELRLIYPEPTERVANKVSDHITEVGKAFIAASPFVMLATSDGGDIDCSPKGDAPGFVQVLDERTLVGS